LNEIQDSGHGQRKKFGSNYRPDGISKEGNKMAVEHTPGPWHVEPEEASAGSGIVICGGDSILATITPEDDQSADPVDWANAFVLAAAPDLLAACEQAIDFVWNELRENPGKQDMDGSVIDRLLNLQTDILAAAHKAKGGGV
jgi:hypothetical protein